MGVGTCTYNVMSIYLSISNNRNSVIPSSIPAEKHRKLRDLCGTNIDNWNLRKNTRSTRNCKRDKERWCKTLPQIFVAVIFRDRS